MIQLYTGTPGSGKSLHMAKDIFYYASSRRDRLVITNFDVVREKLKYPDRVICVTNKQLKTPDLVIEIAKNYFESHNLKESSIILFIDEAQLIFNSRSWNEDGRAEWLSFFTQHRKLGFNVILVAQFDMMIDKQMRSLIEYETIHRKVSNYGLFGLFLKLFCFGQDLFIAVEKWYTLNEKTGSNFFFARPKYYSLYDTFNTFGTQH